MKIIMDNTAVDTDGIVEISKIRPNSDVTEISFTVVFRTGTIYITKRTNCPPCKNNKHWEFERRQNLESENYKKALNEFTEAREKLITIWNDGKVDIPRLEF